MIRKIHEHSVISLIIAGVILYFSILGVALATDPEFMPKRSEDLVHYSDFSAVSGTGSMITDDALVFADDQYMSIFSATMPLLEMERITVEFVVDCSETSQGAVLHVDVIGDNYDAPEQEFVVTLKKGINEVSEMIPITGNIPDELHLRIFTLDPADYSLTELSVTAIGPASRPVAIWIAQFCTVISAVVFLSLLGYKFFGKKS